MSFQFGQRLIMIYPQQETGDFPCLNRSCRDDKLKQNSTPAKANPGTGILHADVPGEVPHHDRPPAHEVQVQEVPSYQIQRDKLTTNIL